MTRRDLLAGTAGASLMAAQSSKRRNVIFVLTDDHRYDAFGFTGAQPMLHGRTPEMDRLASEGVHFKNAFVTTSLCSPSRASILTGVYAHRHKIIDNSTAIPAGTRFFPELLQKAGYDTGFFGKWHMGNESDSPQPGFSKWVSFRGQGSYFPERNGLNVDGKRVAQKGHITTELTDYATTWLRDRPKDKPYFMYLSHKAVHAPFAPLPRDKGVLDGSRFVRPATMARDAEGVETWPRWVRDQRNSFHGADFPYHSRLDLATYYQQYAETLLGVDRSLGQLRETLAARGELDSTLVIYMGDNGFAFGEHGLIDKRTAFEESMRVPMLARCPELFRAGSIVTKMTANLDIMPTVLDVAGVAAPAGLDGRSMLRLAQSGDDPQWRRELLYEYFWESDFPQTPTQHALREDRYKYVLAHGVWDTNQLYDLEMDPHEAHNLISQPEHAGRVKRMNSRLFELLKETGGLSLPLYPDSGSSSNLRDENGAAAVDFPKTMKKK